MADEKTVSPASGASAGYVPTATQQKVLRKMLSGDAFVTSDDFYYVQRGRGQFAVQGSPGLHSTDTMEPLAEAGLVEVLHRDCKLPVLWRITPAGREVAQGT